MAETKERRAPRAGRWCARLLVAVGGALAGTAVAWVLAGTAATAADTVPAATPSVHSARADHDTEPVRRAETPSPEETRRHARERSVERAPSAEVVEARWSARNGSARNGGDGPARGADRSRIAAVTNAAVLGLRDVGAVAHAAADDEVRVERRPARRVAVDQEAVDEFRTAVHGLTDRAVLRPVRDTADSLEHMVRQPQDAPEVIARAVARPAELGTEVWGFLRPDRAAGLLPAVRLPELPTELGRPGDGTASPVVPPQPVPPADHTEVFTVKVPATTHHVLGAVADPRYADFAPRRLGGDRDTGAPVQPVRLPLAPPTVPAAPGGTTGGGHLDGLMLGDVAGALAAVDGTVIGTVRSGVRHLPLTPGSQPGVTPD
ncbi:hypothetical protein [Amycolatopsis arida]|uniref:hypothetical protein n=1 Tax=Amycolatopsis arida TaxID=587909 RepID=UPI001065E37C|nr:hypothetical protein [Amycolatopsis arida]